MIQRQIRLLSILFSLILISTVTNSATEQTETEMETAGKFKCADSIDRADGQPRAITVCRKKVEYCYEATGGAAISHGAHCRPLPSINATCQSFVLVPGSSCSGDTSIGIHIDFVFP